MYKLKESTLYLKSGENAQYISYSLSTVHHKLCLRKAFSVPCFWDIYYNINSNFHLRQFLSVSKYV